mgnify:CR=1 FL=1
MAYGPTSRAANTQAVAVHETTLRPGRPFISGRGRDSIPGALMLDQIPVPDDTHVREPTAEEALWTAALVQLVDDGAKCWVSGANGNGQVDQARREAWDDLVSCGPMLCKICDYSGHDAREISNRFVQWCENREPGTSVRKNARADR